MQQVKPVEHLRKHNLYRKPSSNTSIQSAESPPIVKKKFLMQRKNTLLNNYDTKHNHDNFGITRKLKICDGQRLSYEVIKRDSKQKRAQFLQKYAHDPFMRKKFQKSIQKLNSSKSKQISTQKKIPWVEPTPQRQCGNHTYTTFRQQIMQQSQKTVKLINNCKLLVDQLKKNRLKEVENEQRTDEKNRRRFSHLQTRK